MVKQIGQDPITLRPILEQDFNPGVALSTLTGPAGTAIAEALVNNVLDGKRSLVFSGVPDYDTAATDNAAALLADIVTARDSGRALFIPAGRYKIGSAITVDTTDDITIIGEPGTELIWPDSAFCMKLQGSFQTTTAMSTSDALRGTNTIVTAAPHGASVGDQVLIQGNETPETGWGYGTSHISTVSVVTDTTTIELAHPVNFNFYFGTADDVKITTRRGRVRLDGIYFNNLYTVSRVDALIIAQVNGVHIAHCKLTTAEIGSGTTDGWNILESQNVVIDNCVTETTGAARLRYGCLINRSRNIIARNNECNNARHFLAPATYTDGVYCNGLWGRNNTGLVDAHPSFNVHYENVVDQNTSTVDVMNCRSFGVTLRNIYYQNKQPTTSVLIGIISLTGDYVDMASEYDVTIENCKFDITGPNSSVAVNNARLLTVRNIDVNGQQFHIGRDAGTEPGVLDDIVSGINNATIIRRRSPFRERTTPPRGYLQTHKTTTTYTGTATAGAASTMTLEVANSPSVDDVIIGYLLRITGGTGTLNEYRRVTDYDSGTRVATVASVWTTPPASDTTYHLHRIDLNPNVENNVVAFQMTKCYADLVGTNTVGGETNLQPLRIRLFDKWIEYAKVFGRWQNVNFKVHVLSGAGSQTYKRTYEWDWNHKSIPTPSIYGSPYLRSVTGDVLSGSINAQIEDVIIDTTYTFTFIEFTLVLTGHTSTAAWCEIEIIEMA